MRSVCNRTEMWNNELRVCCEDVVNDASPPNSTLSPLSASVAQKLGAGGGGSGLVSVFHRPR